MPFHQMVVPSADGTRLHIRDAGPVNAPALVFLHGWAQASLVWDAQRVLADRFRVICIDLRGHGRSDAPQVEGAYTDTQTWADDVDAVLRRLAPVSPVLVGWSYGARVIGAYLEVYGATNVTGLCLVGGVIALGAAREAWMVAPSSPALNRALYSDDDAKRHAATRDFVRDCTLDPLGSALTERLIAANNRVTPLVRRSLFKADVDLRPVWRDFKKPALIVHGQRDHIVAPAVATAAAACFDQALLKVYPDCGHAPFLEQPARFNRDLGSFVNVITPV